MGAKMEQILTHARAEGGTGAITMGEVNVTKFKGKFDVFYRLKLVPSPSIPFLISIPIGAIIANFTFLSTPFLQAIKKD